MPTFERRCLVATVLILVLVAPTAFSSTGADDAGTGEDASPSASSATRLPAPGTYQANLTPAASDRDWFRIDHPSSGVIGCAMTTVQGVIVADVTLRTTPVNENRQATRNIMQTNAIPLALATPDLGNVWLGVEATDSVPLPGSGSYQFALLRTEISQIGAPDAGTGRDAGASPMGAIVAPSLCFGGRLSPATGDTADTYSLDGVQGDLVVFSIAHKSERPVRLELIDPSGTVVASTTMREVAQFRLEQTGTWFVRPTETSGEGGDYIVGLSAVAEDGPSPNPCRPGCIPLIS
ncbi:MAG: hypothetical protein ACT4PT_12195 [Methanobacteriota archaeon]